MALKGETRSKGKSHTVKPPYDGPHIRMAHSRVEPSDAADRTIDLLDRARTGDEDAPNQLFTCHLPVHRRWASGLLPRWARDIADTTDLVQETVIATLRHLDRFEDRGDGALQANLRQAVINRIRNEIRRLAARGPRVDVDSQLLDAGVSPFDAALSQQRLEQYDSALEIETRPSPMLTSYRPFVSEGSHCSNRIDIESTVRATAGTISRRGKQVPGRGCKAGYVALHR